jgi:hypothetical protein
MPLIVKPNTRRMRAFINSPAERPDTTPSRGGIMGRLRWERIFLAATAIGAIAIAVAVLAAH